MFHVPATMQIVASLLTFVVLVLPIAASSPRALSAPYDGLKVLRVPTGNSTKALDNLIADLHLDRWTTVSSPHSHIDVQVSENLVDFFTREANTINTAAGVSQPIITMHEDLGASIREETEGMFAVTDESRKVGLANNAWFNAYHTYADHQTWLTNMVATYPANSEVVSSGTSTQGRTISGLKIFGSSGVAKSAVIFHGTVHAREWITTMVTEFIAYQLLNNYANSTEVKAYVDKYDFYIFPIVNPDGFAYTQSNSRLWRKNRSTPPSGSTCYGTDINRNWPHSSWGQSGGASTSPCAEDYKGVSAGSTPENTGLRSFITARAATSAGVQLYMDWHSYSQLIMSPYGYSCSAVAADAAEFRTLTTGFATALRAVYGTSYKSGPICTTIYPASGGGVDYAYDNSDAKYSMTAELRDTGSGGFVLPASQIRPSGAETWAGVKYLLTNMKV